MERSKFGVDDVDVCMEDLKRGLNDGFFNLSTSVGNFSLGNVHESVQNKYFDSLLKGMVDTSLKLAKLMDDAKCFCSTVLVMFHSNFANALLGCDIYAEKYSVFLNRLFTEAERFADEKWAKELKEMISSMITVDARFGG